MKNQILTIGKALNRTEQKQVFGGFIDEEMGDSCSDQCSTDANCPTGQECFKGSCMNEDTWMCRKKTS